MQTVETPHDREVGFRHRPRQIVDAATADVRAFACLLMGQIVRAARSSPCAQQTCFAERSFQKIVLQRQLSDLCMQRLHVDGWLRGSLAATGTEHSGCPFLELRLPRCDLIGVDVELLRELSQGSIALQGRKRHPRLEGRRVVPARSSVHGLS